MDDIDKLRERLHDLADKLGALVTRTEVTATKLDGVNAQLGRIETSAMATADKVEGHAMRLATLETRADEAKHAAAKWGAGLGAMLGAAAAAAWSLLSGGHR